MADSAARVDLFESSSIIREAQASQDQFQLDDVVQLDLDTVGLIVGLERKKCRVMSMHGIVVEVQTQNLTKRVINKNMVALDSHKNSIRMQDFVEVVDGPHSGRAGKIIYLYRQFSFIDDDDIFVCKSRHLQLVGGNKAGTATPTTPIAKGPILSGTAPPMHMNGDGRPRGRGSRAGGKSAEAHHHRKLIGTTIKISGGAYKGNVGIVKDVTEEAIRVELHSVGQTIAVRRSHITIVGASNKKGGPSSCARTPANKSRSPTQKSARTPPNTSIIPTQNTAPIMTNSPIIEEKTKGLDMPLLD